MPVQLLAYVPKPQGLSTSLTAYSSFIQLIDLLSYNCFRFLVDVAAKDSNRMSPMGLAIVFGPNLFR